MIKDCCCCGSEFHLDLGGSKDRNPREAEVKAYDDWCARHQKCLQIEQSIMLIKHSLLLEKTKVTYSRDPKTSGSSTSGLN